MFKRKKAVTVPTLKMAIDKPIYVKFEAITRKQTLDKKTGEIKIDSKTGEIDLLPVAKVINLETGENNELVLGSVLIAQLEAEYTAEEITGKCFEIEKHNKPSGKDYHTYSIYEIEGDEVSNAK